MFATVPLLAFDIMDFAVYAVVLVIMVIGWINQLIAKNREAAQRGRRPPRPAREVAGAGDQRDEVEEFLRDVIKRRERGGPSREPEVELIEPQPETTRRLVEARQIDDAPRMKKRLPKPKRATKSRPKPQSKVELADERLATRMHDVFDHQAGSLDDGSAPVEREDIFAQPQFKQQIATSSVTAAGLGAMLRDQQNLKQAIVLMEILKRPEERW